MQGSDATICENSVFTVSSATALNYSSLLWTTSGDGVLSNETTLTPTYTPDLDETGDVTLTLTVYGNAPCGTAVDAMVIHIMPAVSADAGSDATSVKGRITTSAELRLRNSSPLMDYFGNRNVQQ